MLVKHFMPGVVVLRVGPSHILTNLIPTTIGHPLLPSMQGTVKKAMSEFRRTHYDSWSEHKQKFTDDQLAVLADLLISPSYYA